MIEAEGLSKYYAEHRAISGIHFKIQAGEIVGLLGLNGAGKSTILKILGTFLLPSSGTARVFGMSVEEAPHEIRKMIGYLPDTPPLYDEMQVEAYLRYVAKLKDVPREKISSRVDQVMRETDTVQVARKNLGELSHGFRQRVGIAQALVHDPKVIILDEPINGLDPVQIVEMRDLITSLRGKHTVVLSSHILSEITKTCDRILIVDRGRLVAEGSEAELSGRMAHVMHLVLDVETLPSGFVDKLGALASVQNVEIASGTATPRLLLTTSADVRRKVAEAAVASGAGLLGLSRSEAGLEKLFMQLIHSDAHQANRTVGGPS